MLPLPGLISGTMLRPVTSLPFPLDSWRRTDFKLPVFGCERLPRTATSMLHGYLSKFNVIHGSMYSGSGYDTGPHIRFLHSRNSNVGQLPHGGFHFSPQHRAFGGLPPHNGPSKSGKLPSTSNVHPDTQPVSASVWSLPRLGDRSSTQRATMSLLLGNRAHGNNYSPCKPTNHARGLRMRPPCCSWCLLRDWKHSPRAPSAHAFRGRPQSRIGGLLDPLG